MVEISSNLKKLLYSNVLPRTKIKISIKKITSTFGENGIDYEENEVMSFTDKDITNVSFEQEVDIIGSELPTMKLSWEQNLFAGNSEQIISNINSKVKEKMAVDFYTTYSYTTYFSWQNIYEETENWDSIYNESKTWGDVFYSKEEEQIKTKRTFLSSKPLIEGNKIKWESRDLLFFLDGLVEEYTDFLSTSPESENYYPVENRKSLVEAILGKESLRLYNSEDKSIEFAITKTTFEEIDYSGSPYDENWLGEPQIFIGVAKNVIKNALSPVDCFIDFNNEDGSLAIKNSKNLIYGEKANPKREIYLKNQRNFPEIENGKNISSYVFDTSRFFVDYEDSYIVEPSNIIYEQGEGYTSQFFMFDEPSTRYSENDEVYVEPKLLTDYSVIEGLNFIQYNIKGEYLTPIKLRLYRIKKRTSNNSYKINEQGVPFNEKNELNPFFSSGFRNYAKNRAELLSSYYNSNNSTVSTKTYGDPSIEPCDFISVETNIKNKDTGGNITKKGIVTSTELLYNGATKETITIHELN